jgi:2-oxoisovalerate dehydrogenase E2 component (dihydrolipoyl transacylase)
MSAAHRFSLPDLGEGLTEAEIVRWLVHEGETVVLNQVIAEVETAKAMVELPSPFAGVVGALLQSAGATVQVGEPIIEILAQAAPAEPGADEQPSPTTVPVLVGYGPTSHPAGRRARRPGSTTTQVGHLSGNGHQPHRAVTPPVRKLARTLGVDLAQVAPTGTAGTVTKQDVLAAAVPPTRPSAQPAPLTEVRTPIRGVRKHVAQAMVTSAFTAPHVTEILTVDVTRSLRLLDRLRQEPEFTGARLSPLVLVMRATILAVLRHPQINASWDEQSQEIVQYRDVNLGIAVATARGLIVPNISRAHTMTLRELAVALAEIVSEARAGKTPAERMSGGTITISNVGVFGVDAATPILNPGEAAILAFGQISERPWAHRGHVRLRMLTTLSLSFDHRLVDGELGSRMLADIGRLLTDPATALAW